MTILVDTNVLLDVFAQRQPHYAASAQVVSEIFNGVVHGICASHCLTTIYYLVKRHSSAADADEAIGKILKHMEVAALDKAGWLKVRDLALDDFEDGAVAITAHLSAASFIVTRNLPDFLNSPVPAITPGEFLNRFIAQP